MTSEAVRALAEELSEHQSNRGHEFREVSTDERIAMAQPLVRARSMANASGADWSSLRWWRHVVREKNEFVYAAADASISMRETQRIWWSVVHDDPSPQEREELI